MELASMHFIMRNESDLLTLREDIFQEVLKSKIHGNVIGINSARLGEGMFLTAVEDLLLDHQDLVVILKPYDTTGLFFPTNRIKLGEIRSVFPFQSPFVNPFLDKLSSSTEEIPGPRSIEIKATRQTAEQTTRLSTDTWI